jgi:hypothetical protein
MGNLKFVKDDFQTFDVVCVDATSLSGSMTENKTYKVVGAVQGFFVIEDDKGVIGMFFRERFKLVEEE